MMRVLHRNFAFLMVSLVIAAVADRSAHSQITSTVNAAVIYRLSPASSLQRGCFAPCMCPLQLVGSPRGTMVLTPLPSTTATIFDYRVDDVNWLVQAGNAEWRITGTGLLRRLGAPAVGAQRLELDLKINSEPVAHFDSGWVLPTTAIPNINLVVSINGGVCYDTVIRVVAAPVPASQLLRYHVTNTSTWMNGCFDPCTCPITTRPLRGSFTLVPIPSANSTTLVPTEYAVVNVRLSVLSPSISTTNTTTAIRSAYRGYGFHRRNLPLPTSTAPTGQRMFLDLQRQNVTTASLFERFDTGIVPTPVPFPALDVTLSKNGMVCLDTVLDMQASPITATTP